MQASVSLQIVIDKFEKPLHVHPMRFGVSHSGSNTTGCMKRQADVMPFMTIACMSTVCVCVMQFAVNECNSLLADAYNL